MKITPREFYNKRNARLKFYTKRADRRGVKLAPRHIERLRDEIYHTLFNRYNIPNTLDNHFKYTYSPIMEDMLIKDNWLLKNIKKERFTSNKPVILGTEHGVITLDNSEET